MTELIQKINDGRYKLGQENGEAIKIETCLFLLECMQLLEQDRIGIENLLQHPFVSEELSNYWLTDLDIEQFDS